MRIAILCYPTVGGSGIVATELAKQLARRGHEIHVVSTEVPIRLRTFVENVYFHQVDTPAYPLFKDPPTTLALANKLAQIHKRHGLDIIHAHYAVPHATAAFLAREMCGPGGPKVVTTLHGTDITLMGADPTFAEIIRFSIEASDQVTAVSNSLRKNTLELLGAQKEIQVVHNFLDLEEWRRVETPGLCKRIHACGEKILVHASNFRPVKRPQDVIQVFNWVRHSVPAKLLMIGEGPELAACQQLSDRLGLRDMVLYMGVQDQIVPLLSTADLFLLPSSQEAFGLAALEAMACGAPVIASTAGGLPEVVVEGQTGHLLPIGDVEGMASRAISLLSDPVRHGRMSQAAVERVKTHFAIERVIPQYERVYESALGYSSTAPVVAGD